MPKASASKRRISDGFTPYGSGSSLKMNRQFAAKEKETVDLSGAEVSKLAPNEILKAESNKSKGKRDGGEFAKLVQSSNNEHDGEEEEQNYNDDEEEDDTSHLSGNQAISKALKRKLRHDLFVQKLKETKQAINQQQKGNNKNKANKKSNVDTKALFATQLGDISAALDDAAEDDEAQAKNEQNKKKQAQQQQQQQQVKTNKARKNVANAEIERFTKVLAHPTFKKNPLGTLQMHIKNSLANANK
ncbi:hypothetical protein GQ42DRAFT_164091 [Ramicandelaber brevisporus]|nr:hypothetical protein GQ42DRAFT_164091 [Ramicandelaber brevisporus]